MNEDERTAITLLDELEKTLEDSVASMLIHPTEFDPRWVSIGRTHLQQGIMALKRSIFSKPG